MKIILIITGMIIASIVGVYAMNQSSEPDLRLRYRITINVETPEGIKSGSAVREIIIDKFQGFNPDKADYNSDIYGEAVVVDLGERKLFGLLRHDSYDEVFYTFRVPGHAPLSEEGIAHFQNLPVGTKGEAMKYVWPQMVTFLDMDDPTSVKQVINIERGETYHVEDYHITEDHMEEYFGEGVSIKSVIVEITDEPVSYDKVDTALPWLMEYKKKQMRLSGSKSIAILDNELANNLGTGSFKIRRNRK